MRSEHSQVRRLAYPLIDAAVFVALWQKTMAVTGVNFPFGIMQNFSRADYDAYVRVMGYLVLALFALSIVMHSVTAGSVGKVLAGMKTVQVNGAPMTRKQIVWRAVIMFLLGLGILAPGPLVAFFIGKGSEMGSFGALALGFLALWVTTLPLNEPQSVLERWLGIKTVRR